MQRIQSKLNQDRSRDGNGEDWVWSHRTRHPPFSPDGQKKMHTLATRGLQALHRLLMKQ